MTMNTVGTCGNCGGPVQVPLVWFGTVPPTPTCAHCGATTRANHGPVLPMHPPTISDSDIAAAAEVRRFWRGDGYRA